MFLLHRSEYADYDCAPAAGDCRLKLPLLDTWAVHDGDSKTRFAPNTVPRLANLLVSFCRERGKAFLLHVCAGSVPFAFCCDFMAFVENLPCGALLRESPRVRYVNEVGAL